MKYQHIFFDLDGTLTDSADGIVNSVRYALEKQGIVPPAREPLLPFVGPPLLDSFHKYYGMDRNRACRRSKRTGNILQTGAGRRIPSMRVFRRY